MENRERGPEGFSYPDEVRQDLMEAFGLQQGHLWSANEEKIYKLTRATKFLKTLEERASEEGLTQENSVQIIITALEQTSIEELSHNAQKTGFTIDNQATTERGFGSVIGELPLQKAPEFVKKMYQNPDGQIIELAPRRPRPTHVFPNRNP